MTKDQPAGAVEPIVKQFGAIESSTQPKWLLPLRKAGAASFAELGFPTLRDEDWRFTNVAPIEKLTFIPAKAVTANGAETRLLENAAFAKLPGNRLVFVNGFFSAELSNLISIGQGARVENL